MEDRRRQLIDQHGFMGNLIYESETWREMQPWQRQEHLKRQHQPAKNDGVDQNGKSDRNKHD